MNSRQRSKILQTMPDLNDMRMILFEWIDTTRNWNIVAFHNYSPFDFFNIPAVFASTACRRNWQCRCGSSCSKVQQRIEEVRLSRRRCRNTRRINSIRGEVYNGVTETDVAVKILVEVVVVVVDMATVSV